jgi:hypothetical protein
MQEIFHNLEREINKRVPFDKVCGLGMMLEEIEALEKQHGIMLREDIKALYQWVSYSHPVEIFAGFFLSSLESALSERDRINELLAIHTRDNYCPMKIDEEFLLFLNDDWGEQCVIGLDSGCIYYIPSHIYMRQSDGSMRVKSMSIEHLLLDITEDFQKGEYVFEIDKETGQIERLSEDDYIIDKETGEVHIIEWGDSP